MAKVISLMISIALILSLASLMSAGAVGATEVDIDMKGNNYKFEVITRMNDLPFDNFSGEAHSSLVAYQTVNTQWSGTWTYDAPDIDRYAEFNGSGSISAFSEYNCSAQWSWGHAGFDAYVNSDNYGFLGQNLHFDTSFGGVRDVDPWKKQRDMSIVASGTYNLGFSATDLRQPGDNNWDFGFHTSDNSSYGNLYVNTSVEHVEHGSGQWYTPDRYTVDSAYGFVGNPSIVNYWTANRGGSIQVILDLINSIVSAFGTIW